MISSEPLETLLPGRWQLSFERQPEDNTGAGDYEFKLAGTFNAEVRELYSGTTMLRGYWQVENARLILESQEVSARCLSCLGGGTAHNWTVELEQVADSAFSGVLHREDGDHVVVFERLH